MLLSYILSWSFTAKHFPEVGRQNRTEGKRHIESAAQGPVDFGDQ